MARASQESCPPIRASDASLCVRYGKGGSRCSPSASVGDQPTSGFQDSERKTVAKNVCRHSPPTILPRRVINVNDLLEFEAVADHWLARITGCGWREGPQLADHPTAVLCLASCSLPRSVTSSISGHAKRPDSSLTPRSKMKSVARSGSSASVTDGFLGRWHFMGGNAPS
jgi:hypothetical protein